jgi:drug/metabolite transporter (DMT)-like permease
MHPAGSPAAGQRRAFLDSRAGAIILLLVAGLLWGSAFPGIKRGYVLLGIGPGALRAIILFAGVRFVLSGLLVLGGSLVGRVGVRPERRRFAGLLLLGLVQTALQYAAFYVGMAYTTGTKAALITASSSFFLAAFSPLFFPEDRLTLLRGAGLALGFAGVAVANLSGGTLAGGVWIGDVLMLVTGLCSAGASLLTKRMVRSMHPLLLNGWQVFLGGLMLLAVALPLGPPDLPPIPFELVALTVYLALVTAIAFSLYYVVLRHHDLTLVATYRFVIPLCGFVESSLLIPNESLGWPLLAAAALVVAGIWVVHRGPDADSPRP